MSSRSSTREAWMSRVKASVAALACACCACLIQPALAAARVDDVAATRAYLHAGYAYERSAGSQVARSVAAIEARAKQIAGECPAVLTYAPRDAAFGELGEEANKSAFYAGVVPLRSAALRQARAIGHLSWSDRKLTLLVQSEAAAERSIAALTLPDVCADIVAWQASAYATLPQSSMRYLARINAIESTAFVGPSEESREAAIMRLLRRYEGPAERRAAKRIQRLEAQNEKRLGAATTAARAKLAAALGVSTL
jgi:hypothetical protein